MKEIWLVSYKKHTGKAQLSYEDTVQEALCFGWIDSLIRRLDDERYAQKYTPRRPGSRWSLLNKQRVARLIREGRMTSHGLAKITVRLETADLQTKNSDEHRVSEGQRAWFRDALKGHPKALTNFKSLGPSYQKLYIRWVTEAKREETQIRRLKEAIVLLNRIRKLGLK
jgi:uncharacterized protein YdeI (YjbR/CyaY-like superfamily)